MRLAAKARFQRSEGCPASELGSGQHADASHGKELGRKRLDQRLDLGFDGLGLRRQRSMSQFGGAGGAPRTSAISFFVLCSA